MQYCINVHMIECERSFAAFAPSRLLEYEYWARNEVKRTELSVQMDSVLIEITRAHESILEEQRNKFRDLFAEHDEDGDGVLTLREFTVIKNILSGF